MKKVQALTHGSILLEIILALSLTVPLSLLIYRQIQQSKQQYQTSKQQGTFGVKLLRFASLMSRAMTDSNSQRLVSTRIHQTGKITFANGAFLPLSAALAPEFRSNAFSVMEASIRDSLLIESYKTGEAIACLRFANSFPSTPIRSYLAIDADGISEFVAQGIQSAANNACRKFKLQASLGILTNPPPVSALEYARQLIPILRTYTLYVDKHHQLRYLATVGRKIIENQPIIQGIDSLSIKLLPAPASGITSLECEISIAGKTNKMHFQSRLTIRTPSNFQFNRP